MSDKSIACHDAVILAGGLGTRLGALTSDIPKPLVMVGERVFLEHQLLMLKRHGVRRVLLLIGYLGEKIRHHFGNGNQVGLRLEYSQEKEPIGTAGALLLAEKMLPPDFFLVYGDSFLDFDYQEAFRVYDEWRLQLGTAVNKEKPLTGAMIVGPSKGGDTEPGNVKVESNSSMVEGYKKGGGVEYRFVDAGVLILTSSVVDLIPRDRSVCNLEQAIYPILAQQHRLLAITTQKPFYDIGTPNRLSLFARSIK